MSSLVTDSTERLRAILHDYVPSYEALEALMLLAREPTRPWTDSEVAMLLNVSVEPIAEALDALHEAGVILAAQESGLRTFRYAPRDEQLKQQIAELQRAYSEQRLTIVQLMSANALERVRSSAAKRLADAFRIERSKK